VQETPELFLLLDRCDFAFIGSPRPDWPIQTNIWGFRSNERSRRFAREWARQASGRRLSDASGLPFALLERDPELRVKVLTLPAEAGHEFAPAPDFQVTSRKIAPRVDRLGFKHPQVGRAKIVHLGGLRASGNDSVGARIEAVVAKFPHCSLFLPHYVTLANRAAGKLGMQTLPHPVGHLSRELDEAGVLAHRGELPTLLNQRGLLGSAVEIGVANGAFSELILSRWRGAHLLSVDPWRAAPPDEYVDVSNRSQEGHDEAYETTKQRLCPVRRAEQRMADDVDGGGFPHRSGKPRLRLPRRATRLRVRQAGPRALVRQGAPGGIFAGHDYRDGVPPQGVFGVKSAVNEFFGAKGLPVKATHVDAPWSSWFVEIPGSRPNGN